MRRARTGLADASRVFLDGNIVATPSSYFQNGEPILLWGASNLSLDSQHLLVISCLNLVSPNVVQIDAVRNRIAWQS